MASTVADVIVLSFISLLLILINVICHISLFDERQFQNGSSRCLWQNKTRFEKKVLLARNERVERLLLRPILRAHDLRIEILTAQPCIFKNEEATAKDLSAAPIYCQRFRGHPHRTD